MKKTYNVEIGSDLQFIIELDESIMTEEYATMVNDFWSGSSDCLSASNGDIYKAVIRRAITQLIPLLMQGYNEYGMIAELEESEGWPSPCGLKVIEAISVDTSYSEIVVEELK